MTDIEQIIDKCNKFHNNKYDYSLVEYINKKTKIKIICPEHGIFEQTPKQHYSHGCRFCSSIKNGSINKTTLSVFIDKSNIIHNNKYDYTLINMLNNLNEKIQIVCPIHGMFEQVAYRHLNGSICSKCKSDNRKNKSFIDDANRIHNNKYDYSLVEYINNKTKIKIICPDHGIFFQRPDSHLQGKGCSKCKRQNILNCDLYIIKDDINKLIKIGSSNRLQNRLIDLKHSINNELYISDQFFKMSYFENNIQKEFYKYNKNHPIYHSGYTEWFDDIIYDDVIDYIKSLNYKGL
jgi:hypothetical protein